MCHLSCIPTQAAHTYFLPFNEKELCDVELYSRHSCLRQLGAAGLFGLCLVQARKILKQEWHMADLIFIGVSLVFFMACAYFVLALRDL